MKFSLLAFVTLTTVIGVYCQTFGSYGYPYYYTPYRGSRNNTYLWLIGGIFILALIFPAAFGPLGTGITNFAGALTGRRMTNTVINNGTVTNGGNVPPIGG